MADKTDAEIVGNPVLLENGGFVMLAKQGTDARSRVRPLTGEPATGFDRTVRLA